MRGIKMNKIKVISDDIDGSELRKEKNRNRYFIKCRGKADNNEINEAVESSGSKKWFGIAKSWNRIFGGKENGI
jgi:hypothetical protein